MTSIIGKNGSRWVRDCFFRKEKFLNKVEWNQELPCFEDLDFVMQLAVVDPNGYFYIQEVLFDYHQRYGDDGVCSKMSYQQWGNAFAKLLELHKNDPLLIDPQSYYERIEKYLARQIKFERGELLAPYLKYFPEFA